MLIAGYLWFVNSVLALFLSLSTFYFIFFADITILHKPLKKSFVSDIHIPEQNKNLNYDIITQRDIFNALPITIKEKEKPAPISPRPVIKLLSPPHFPEQIQEKYIEEEVDNFLPPLQLTVKGTIISHNPRQNRVFIENNRSKEEKIYTIGDIVEDSQIVFIGKNKVTFIRSNGQQEIIYLTLSAAEEELGNKKVSWDKIITDKNNIKEIDIRLFLKKIRSIGEFLDALDVVTYFKNNVPLGCQIGIQNENSLGTILGLLQNDLITEINGMSVATPEARIDIYRHFINFNLDKENEITVSLIRENKKILLTYKLYYSKNKIYNNHESIFNQNENAVIKKRSLNESQNIKNQVSYNGSSLDALANTDNKSQISKAGKRNAIYRGQK